MCGCVEQTTIDHSNPPTKDTKNLEDQQLTNAILMNILGNQMSLNLHNKSNRR